jgi:hypothetical protein
MADPILRAEELLALKLPIDRKLECQVYWLKGQPTECRKKSFPIHSFSVINAGNFGFHYIPEAGATPKAHNIHPMMVHEILVEPDGSIHICTI